jgi:hypothetical protein
LTSAIIAGARKPLKYVYAARITKAMMSGRSQHHLDADQLEGDVRHRRQNAGERDRQRQPVAVVPTADEVSTRDVVVPAGHRPQPRHDHEHERVDDDGVRQREQTVGAGAEDRRGNGDERVGGVEIPAQQEPGHDRPEPSAGQAPLVEQCQVAAAPVGGQEAQDGHQQEQRHEDRQRHDVDATHAASSSRVTK